MQTEPLTFSFPNSTTAEGNRFAESLGETLRSSDPSVEVTVQRDRPDTQDFGATLAVIAGTAAATAVAKGVAAWLARNSDAHVEIKVKGKVEVVLNNLDSADVAQTIKAISSLL